MADCGCKPGSYEDGWQEQRSEACEKAEMAGWAWMLDQVAGKEAPDDR
jgi:hypothetical protein